MATDLSSNLSTVTLATGALGAASYGVVDGMKFFPWIDLAGFERLFSVKTSSAARRWPIPQEMTLDPLVSALNMAYGPSAVAVCAAQYRNGRSKGDLPRTLRQGVRIGLSMMSGLDIESTATKLGMDPESAKAVALALRLARDQRPPAAGETGERAPVDLSDDARNAIARLETAIDARIDAALVLAESQYVTQNKVLAMLVALAISLAVGTAMDQAPSVCVLVGLAAVPVAPVAKDLSTALQEAVKALRAR